MDRTENFIAQYEEGLFFDDAVKCPECGSLLFSHNPLSDAEYICNECGYHFSED